MRVFDLLGLAVALPIAYHGYLHFPFVETHGVLPPMAEFGVPLVVALVLWGAGSWLAQVYEPPVSRTLRAEIARVTWALIWVALALVAIAFFTKQHDVSRLLTALYFAASLALLVVNRLALRVFGKLAHRSGWHRRRYAVVGTGGLAREMVQAVEAHPEWGLEFAGFIQVDEPGEPVSRGPVLGHVAQIGRILEHAVIDQVVFAVPRDHLGEIEGAIQICEEQGISAQLSLDILRFGQSRISVGELDGVPMLAFTRTPSNTIALAAKRAFDVAVSLVAILLLAPVLLAVAAAIRLDSPGPILFRQRRVGLNGRVFDMYKFRSMYQDAEERLESLRARNEMNGPVFKMANDPRVTRVGRLLRKTSLDEFPQFWNVLRGHMSVVGPRPPIPSEVQQYKRWQRRRLSVKPGITCIWQISGRNEIDFDRWMELDLQYIDSWSLWRDVEICIKTIPAVLAARGAR